MVFTTQPYKSSKTDSQPFTAQLFIHKRPLITVLTELEIPGHPAQPQFTKNNHHSARNYSQQQDSQNASAQNAWNIKTGGQTQNIMSPTHLLDGQTRTPLFQDKLLKPVPEM